MEIHDRPQRCKEIFALLSDYLNLELPLEACKEIEAHLAGCPPCVRFVESLQRTVELCRRYTPAALPPPLAQSMHAELRRAYDQLLAGQKKPGKGKRVKKAGA